MTNPAVRFVRGLGLALLVGVPGLAVASAAFLGLSGRVGAGEALLLPLPYAAAGILVGGVFLLIAWALGGAR
jgi:hypothetical protein